MSYSTFDLNVQSTEVGFLGIAVDDQSHHFVLMSSLQSESVSVNVSLMVPFISLCVCHTAAPSCVQQRSSHSATRPVSSMTLTARWWECLWTLTSPTWRGSTLHARYCLSLNSYLVTVTHGASFSIHLLMGAINESIVNDWSASSKCNACRNADILVSVLILWYYFLVFYQTGGLGHIHIPLLSDLNKQISRDYGVLLEGPGIALRWVHYVLFRKCLFTSPAITERSYSFKY